MRVLVDKAGLASTLLCDYLQELLAEEELTAAGVCVCARARVHARGHACTELSLPFGVRTRTHSQRNWLNPHSPPIVTLYFIDSKT